MSHRAAVVFPLRLQLHAGPAPVNRSALSAIPNRREVGSLVRFQPDSPLEILAAESILVSSEETRAVYVSDDNHLLKLPLSGSVIEKPKLQAPQPAAPWECRVAS